MTSAFEPGDLAWRIVNDKRIPVRVISIDDLEEMPMYRTITVEHLDEARIDLTSGPVFIKSGSRAMVLPYQLLKADLLEIMANIKPPI